MLPEMQVPNNPRLHPDAQNIIFLVGALVVVAAGISMNYNFIGGVDMDLVGKRGALDGFNSQLIWAERTIASGDFSTAFANPLFFVHLVRYIVSVPFLWAETLFGSVGSLALLLACIYPLYSAFGERGTSLKLTAFYLVRAVPLAVLLLTSGRTMLVAIGAGYLIYGLYNSGTKAVICIVAAVAFLSLSSGALVCGAIAFIAILLFSRREVKLSRADWVKTAVAFSVMAVLLAPSIANKVVGFSSGAEGYVAATEAPRGSGYSAPVVNKSLGELVGITPEASTERPIAATTVEQQPSAAPQVSAQPPAFIAFVDRVVSRSTLYVSFAYGQKFRLIVYLAMLAMSWAFVVWAIFTRQGWRFAAPVAGLSFGLLLEGAAAWSVLFALAWAYGSKGSPIDYLVGLLELNFRKPEAERG